MLIDRQKRIEIFGNGIQLPCYFPSVSSIKCNLPAIDYIELLCYTNHQHFLISAYDFARHNQLNHDRLNGAIQKGISGGSQILLDSGNYEKFWNNDNSWTQDRHNDVLRRFSPHFCFSFDNQNPSSDEKIASDEVVGSCLNGQGEASGIMVPIVHGKIENIAEVARMVAKEIRPPLIAIPERELGSGLLSRARKIQELRRVLNELGAYIPMHILGTGNPRSIALFSIAGADTFDGLEWCQTVVDHKSSNLHHFQHGDVFLHQTNFNALGLPFAQTVCLHNLAYYTALENALNRFIFYQERNPLIDSLLNGDYESIFSEIIKGAA